MYARRVRILASAMLLAACHRTPAAAPPAACEVLDRVEAQHEDCRRAHPGGLPVEAVTEHRRGSRALYASIPPPRAARMCAFAVDQLRLDMALDGCVPALTAGERGVIDDARLRVTAAPHTADPAHQATVDAIAQARDRECACADKPCVDAADAEVKKLPLESLKTESQAVHDAVDAILSDAYECATRPQIISPDRWAKVPPVRER